MTASSPLAASTAPSSSSPTTRSSSRSPTTYGSRSPGRPSSATRDRIRSATRFPKAASNDEEPPVESGPHRRGDRPGDLGLLPARPEDQSRSRPEGRRASGSQGPDRRRRADRNGNDLRTGA